MTKTRNLYLRIEPDLMAAIEKEAAERGDPWRKPSVARAVLREHFIEGKPVAKKKPRAKKKPAPPKTETDRVVGAVYALWDKTLPQHIRRPRTRNKSRDANIMNRYLEVSCLNRWEYAMIALSLSAWHMGKNDKGPWHACIDYFVRPGTTDHPQPFGKWVDAGMEIKKHGIKAEQESEYVAAMRKEKANEQADGEL